MVDIGKSFKLSCLDHKPQTHVLDEDPRVMVNSLLTVKVSGMIT